MLLVNGGLQIALIGGGVYSFREIGFRAIHFDHGFEIGDAF